MENQTTTTESTAIEPQKSEWNTPELEVFHIKEITQAGGPGTTDAGFFS